MVLLLGDEMKRNEMKRRTSEDIHVDDRKWKKLIETERKRKEMQENCRSAKERQTQMNRNIREPHFFLVQFNSFIISIPFILLNLLFTCIYSTYFLSFQSISYHSRKETIGNEKMEAMS